MISEGDIRLWPLEQADLMSNYQWANDRELIRLAGMHPTPKSAREIERWYESVVGNQEVEVFAMKTADHDYFGNIELRSIDHRCGRAEVGVLIGDRGYWQKGYGSRAVRALCRFAFEELRFHRLYAKVLEYNPRAQRVFKKCGFKEEGIERQAHYAQGRFWDVVMLGLLSTEFE